MAPKGNSSERPQKWPPMEYFLVRRPMEDWVPPLEVLEEMRKDEPNRFLSWTGTHESACMALYDQGKTREEVFREVSSRPSGAEYNSALEEERQRENERLSSSLGLFPGLEGRDVNQKQSAGGFKRLNGTSQGSRFDVPPKTWIEEELIAFGARRPHGTTRIPDLEGEIHVALRQERWPEMDQNRFDALRQSLLFASNLLHLSSAALASFFPKAIRHPQRNVGHAIRRAIIASPIDDDELFTTDVYKKLAIPAQYFGSLAKSITWVESSEILSQNSWFGINGSGMTEPQERDEEWDWEAARERDTGDGHTTRQITIAIASEFVDAILISKPDSEQHLFATFYAGITIAHELAHFWALHRYSTVPHPAFGEPFFGDSLDMELGDAYISWLFDGFVPHPIGNGSNEGSFDQGMQWIRTQNVGMTDSHYDVRYSMDIPHIERMLSHEEWKAQIKLNNPAAARRALLHPKVPFRVNEVARTVKWRSYDLSEIGLAFDSRGLAVKGDEGFVDYSLCPLRFCDLDWDDVLRDTSANAAGISGETLKSSHGKGKTPVKALEKQKMTLQVSLGSTQEGIRNLNLKKAREQNALNEIEVRLEKSKRDKDGPSCDTSSSKHIGNTKDDTPDDGPKKKKLAPLPAAARLFFQHDMPKEQRQRLENNLRLFHHKKQVGTGDQVDYDSDDSTSGNGAQW